MEKILSITIPAYNIEQYIEQCLDSFVIDEIINDIEVLIINDGSKDSTAMKALEYEKKFPQTFKVINKENGGHGSTVNKGIELAKGKYFKVVDGDDWVQRDTFIQLIKYLKTTNADMIYHNYLWYYDFDKSTKHEFQEPFKGVEYKKEYLFDEIATKTYLKMHGIVIKSSILSQNAIELDENRFYVDMEYILLPIPFVNTVEFLDLDIYMYRLGLDGQSMNIKSMQRNISHHLGVFDRLCKYYKIQYEEISCEKRRYFEMVLGRMIASQYKIYLSFIPSKGVKSELSEFDRQVKINYPSIYNAVSNSAVKVLRISNFILYKLASKKLRKQLLL